MFQQYFQSRQSNSALNAMERPVKDLVDLNMKAIQNMSYMMPNELLKLRRPEQLLEKQVEMIIENSQTTLAYMQNMFSIMEKHWLQNLDGIVQRSNEDFELGKNAVEQGHSQAKATIKKAANTLKTAVAKTDAAHSKVKLAASNQQAAKKRSSKASSSASKKQSSSAAKHSTASHSGDAKSTGASVSAAKPTHKETSAGKQQS